MSHIANHRYVVQGRRDDDGRVWAIHATDDRTEAETTCSTGRDVDGRHWSGVRVFDRRTAIMPPKGWADVEECVAAA